MSARTARLTRCWKTSRSCAFFLTWWSLRRPTASRLKPPRGHWPGIRDRPTCVSPATATKAVFGSYEEFTIGAALTLRAGEDVGIVATGTMTREALDAAAILDEGGISAAVLHVPTIKPLDEEAIIALAASTGFIVTIEEAQRAGGLGGAVAELLGERRPTRVIRLGVDDRYGESGPPRDVIRQFGLDAESLAQQIRAALSLSTV